MGITFQWIYNGRSIHLGRSLHQDGFSDFSESDETRKRCQMWIMRLLVEGKGEEVCIKSEYGDTYTVQTAYDTWIKPGGEPVPGPLQEGQREFIEGCNSY